MTQSDLDVPAWVWCAFAVNVVALLIIDLGVHWKAQAISPRSALLWSLFWIGAGLAFGAGVWWVFGADAAHQYIAAYAMEKSLSFDNLFLFLLVFSTLGIPPGHQRRALYLGIAGALVLRALFVWLGVEVLTHLAWIDWVFGAVLLFAAIHSARQPPSEDEDSKAAAWLARHLPVATRPHGARLFAREGGRNVVTPIFVAILAIELADIAFAIDSVPAALSISKEPFIVYSSNVFAILGLRSLYALLASTIARLRYLHWGIAAVLAFAAVKIVGERWFHVPALWSVAIIVVCIGTATIASVVARGRCGGAPTSRRATAS